MSSDTDQHDKTVEQYNESSYPRSSEETEAQTELQTDASHSLVKATPSIESDKDSSKDLFMADENETDGDNMTCGVCFQILMDPISLGCGHSFCELCLAGMWKVNRTPVPLCPMCRVTWGRQGDRLPSVNVMLRNIIEQLYPEKLKERRESITDQEKELLQSFEQARIIGTRPRGSIQLNRRIHIPVNRTIVLVLIGIFFSAMVFSMLLVSSVLWVFDNRDDYMLKPIKDWDNQDVLQWMKGLGASVKKECMDVFEKERIDGVHLLSLTDESLSQSFGISNQFHRQSLLLSIDEIRERDKLQPRNFKEFRAVNREEMMLVTFLYNIHPRLTFLYLYFFEYDEMFIPLVKSQLKMRSKMEQEDREEIGAAEIQEDNELFKMEKEEWDQTSEDDSVELNKDNKPLTKTEDSIELSTKQLIAIAIEALLVPHVVVMAFVYTHFSKDSVLFYTLMFYCGMSTFVELKLLRNTLRQQRGRERYSLSQILRSFRNSVMGYMLAFLLLSIVYLILPAILMDMLFYGMLFRPLLVIVYNFILKPCFGRAFRFCLHHINQRLAHRGVVQ